MPHTPGTVLNERFTIDSVLGKGGFGVTYRAWDDQAGRYVALKENFPSWLVQRDAGGGLHVVGDDRQFRWALRHFISEAKLLSSLKHPNIVRGYGTFEDFNTAYFIMEYLEGTPLLNLRNPGDWREDELMYLLEALLDALVYLRKRNVCHRDIKPANIIIRNDFSPVLIDFGAAKQEVSTETYTCGFMTSGFTSPEQIADPNCLAPSIDVYALGATFYCLLTGNPPPGAPERQLNRDHDTYSPLASNPYFNSRFSERLLRSIDVALELDPKYRFAHAGEWQKFLKNKFTPKAKTYPRPQEVDYTFSDEQGTLPYDPSSRRSSSPGQDSYRSSAAEDDEIPMSTILLWAGNLCIVLGCILGACIVVTLFGAGGSSHALDSCLPLAGILLGIGFILRLILRFGSFSDPGDS